MNENVCPTCKHNGNCETQNRLDTKEVICCADYEENENAIN
jgi:hypothetical protein